MTIDGYLKRPYARRLVPDEAGGYVATIQEFPGCIAEGETADEAMINLDIAARAWLEATLAKGKTVPEPVEIHGYSGRFVLRMPSGLHKRAAEQAASEHTSLNQLLVAAVATYLGPLSGAPARSLGPVFIAAGTGLAKIYTNNLVLLSAETHVKLDLCQVFADTKRASRLEPVPTMLLQNHKPSRNING